MVNYWSKIVQLVLPGNCLLCQCSHHINPLTGLCSGCTKSLPWLMQGCRRCALPLPKALAKTQPSTQFCGQCQTPVDRLISRFKFNQQLSYSRLFGQLMAEHIKRQYLDVDLPDMVIPVPLHKHRLRERGFNQAQEVARICASALSLPLNNHQCRRHKQTDHQLGLSAVERRRNLRGAFSCEDFESCKRVALVDDVMTTGTTLQELSSCLKRAGCKEIHLWCIARAHHV